MDPSFAVRAVQDGLAAMLKSRTSCAQPGRRQAARRDPAAARRKAHRAIGGDPDPDGRTGRGDERVALVRPTERRGPADPREPAIELDDAVRPGEQPIRPGGRSSGGRREGDPDGRRRAVGQGATEGDDDGLIPDGRPGGPPVHGELPDPEPSKAGGDGVQLDPVDRPTRHVADLHLRDRRDRASAVRQPEAHVVGRLEVEARPIDRTRHDRSGRPGGPRDRPSGVGTGNHSDEQGGDRQRSPASGISACPRGDSRCEDTPRIPRAPGADPGRATRACAAGRGRAARRPSRRPGHAGPRRSTPPSPSSRPARGSAGPRPGRSAS